MTLAEAAHGGDLVALYGTDEHDGFAALLVDVIAWADSRGYLRDAVDALIDTAWRTVRRLLLDELVTVGGAWNPEPQLPLEPG